MSLCIGGDFVPTNTNKYLFEEGKSSDLFGEELNDIFIKSDLNIFNLEVPITNSNEKLHKAGSPNLKTYSEITNILGNIKPVLLSGANNHIFDYKNEGIKDTLSLLDSKGIYHVGFGGNLQEAKEPIIMKLNGLRVGVYSFAENEFCSARTVNGGVMDMIP